MKRFRTSLILLLAVCGNCVGAQMKQQVITVTGRLTRTVAIGGESTGWAVQLEPQATVGNKQVRSIEIAYPKTRTLEKLENKWVIAIGHLSQQTGVETGERSVLEVTSITEVRHDGEAPQAKGASVLSAGQWLLQDLAGSPVLDHTQATLSFPEEGKVAGNGSCNRFFGRTEIAGDAIKLGPLASSQMACSEAVMNQENKYLRALQAADRFEWKDPYLLVYCRGFEKPLRFTRMSSLNTPTANQSPR